MSILTVPFLSGGKEFVLAVLDEELEGLSDTCIVVGDASEDVIAQGFIFVVYTYGIHCEENFTSKLEFVLQKPTSKIADLRKPKVHGATR